MKEGFCTEVEIVRWIDADTPVIKMTREFSVRLMDSDQKGQFNSPEKNTKEGQDAILFVNSILPVGSRCLLFIPSNDSIKLMDINSFNRILGEIWTNSKKMTDILIENNHGKIQ